MSEELRKTDLHSPAGGAPERRDEELREMEELRVAVASSPAGGAPERRPEELREPEEVRVAVASSPAGGAPERRDEELREMEELRVAVASLPAGGAPERRPEELREMEEVRVAVASSPAGGAPERRDGELHETEELRVAVASSSAGGAPERRAEELHETEELRVAVASSPAGGAPERRAEELHKTEELRVAVASSSAGGAPERRAEEKVEDVVWKKLSKIFFILLIPYVFNAVFALLARHVQPVAEALPQPSFSLPGLAGPTVSLVALLLLKRYCHRVKTAMMLLSIEAAATSLTVASFNGYTFGDALLLSSIQLSVALTSLVIYCRRARSPFSVKASFILSTIPALLALLLVQNDKIPDTSAEDARKGKDIQGIPWERLAITRENYRKTRLEQYKNYENIPNSVEAAAKECRPTEKGGMYYEFRQNTRSVKSTILHFQLRNLVWATSKHDVYLMSHYSVLHWSALSGVDTELMNVQGHVAPREKHPGSLLEGFSQIQVSTLAVKDNLLVAGGFQGELICKNLDREGISFCCRTTYDDNAITNAVEIFNASSGAVHFMASNNDSGVRDYDMERFQLCKHFQFDWPVNHTSLSPDGKLVVIVGDDPNGLLIDANSGKTLHSMKGHHDFSFASAWSPDGRTFATGNQDKTCRIWDARNLSKAVHVLMGNLGAIRSIRFTSDGQFLSMAEPADFVHIFDVKSDYNRRQELDFFGEISGMSFSPDTDALFLGVWDRTYGSLLQFGRLYNNWYHDSLL